MTNPHAKAQARAAVLHTQIHTNANRKAALTLAELELRSYALVDGEELQRCAPETFSMPPAEARATLRAGQTVQLLFRKAWFSQAAERMWVKITGRKKGGYAGRLVNEPEIITALRFGDEVRFTSNNVIKIFSLDYVQRNAGATSNVRDVQMGVNNQ